VRDIPTNANDTAITRAVIALGKSLDLTVLAESIETEAPHGFLLPEGCNQRQGYLCGRPSAAQQIPLLPPDNA